MSYAIDLKRISVQRYEEMLKNQNLLPGRRILLDDIETNFQKIMKAGIEDLHALKNSLSTPQKISAFASAAAIPENYLAILKRELGSLEQKPVLISDFPGIKKETVSKLSANHIKTSKDFFILCRFSDDMDAAGENIGASGEEIKELRCLCDLVRINGVGAIAARVMYESGFNNIAEIARADAADLLKRISDVNASRKYYKANLGVKDMRFIIDFANLILDFEGDA